MSGIWYNGRNLLGEQFREYDDRVQEEKEESKQKNCISRISISELIIENSEEILEADDAVEAFKIGVIKALELMGYIIA